MGQKESFEDKKIELMFLKQQKYLLDEESKKLLTLTKSMKIKISLKIHELDTLMLRAKT